jgi:hypothetical protein
MRFTAQHDQNCIVGAGRGLQTNLVKVLDLPESRM